MPVINETFKMRPKYNWYSRLLRSFYKIKKRKLAPPAYLSQQEMVQKMMSDRKLVIQITNGGLGDHLVYSALPELLLKQQNIQVFISSKSIYRNQEIWDFVWKQNPYVMITDEYGWEIRGVPCGLEHLKNRNAHLRKIFSLEGDDNPRIYYKPTRIVPLEGKMIIDVSFGPSGKANGYFEEAFQKKYISFLREQYSDFILLKYARLENTGPLYKKVEKVFKPDVYIINSLLDLCDVLYSCQDRLLMYSGNASLAAALGLKSTIIYNKMGSEYFQYSLNRYIKLMEDFEE